MELIIENQDKLFLSWDAFGAGHLPGGFPLTIRIWISLRNLSDTKLQNDIINMLDSNDILYHITIDSPHRVPLVRAMLDHTSEHYRFFREIGLLEEYISDWNKEYRIKNQICV